MYRSWRRCLQGIPGDRLFSSLYGWANANKFAVVFWRSPRQNEIRAMVDCAPVKAGRLDLARPDPGFVIAPFVDGSENGMRLSADIICGPTGCHVNPDVDASHLRRLADLENSTNGFRTLRSSDNALSGMTSTPKQDYCDWVGGAIEQIKTGHFRKVVLSRILRAELGENFDTLRVFETVCRSYPDAFVHLSAVPGLGIWIGATPELLLAAQNGVLTTVALAGTRRASVSGKWSDKEVQEQQIVTDYIRKVLRDNGFDHFEERGPADFRIGDLLHLRTQFQMQQKVEDSAVLTLLQNLHPTPAVCGLPKQPSLAFIRDVESHDRDLYSGFLGPVNVDGQSQFYVNLRCLQLGNRTAVLYSGAGITADSIPEKEWQETGDKLDALGRFLKTEISKHK